MITNKVIMDTLEAYEPQRILYDEIEKSYSDIELITKKQDTFSTDILYIGYSTYIESKLDLIDGCTILLVNDMELNNDLLNGTSTSIISFSKETDLFEIFNCVKNIFTEHTDFLSNSSELLNSLVSGNGLDDILNTASRLLENPVLMLDSSYKLLSHSTVFPVQDSLWLENIDRGYCTYEYIAAFNHIADIVKTPDSNTPFTMFCYTSPFQRTISKVYIGRQHVGMLIVLESNKKLDEKSAKLLHLVSEIIAKEIELSRASKPIKIDSYDGVFIDLLEGTIDKRVDFSVRIKGSIFEKHTTYQLFSIDLTNFTGYDSNKMNLKKHLINTLPYLYSVFYKQNIYVLIENKGDKILSTNDLSTFNVFLKENSLTAGVSDSFTDLFELSKYYIQVNKTLYFSDYFDVKYKILHYDDYKMIDMFSHLEEASSLKKYCCSLVVKMDNYDNKNGTEYLSTLFEYIKCGKSLIKTAKKLFIHKNTVSYRINKSKELFGLNLEDEKTEFNIYYSYMMLKYLNRRY